MAICELDVEANPPFDSRSPSVYDLLLADKSSRFVCVLDDSLAAQAPDEEGSFGNQNSLAALSAEAAFFRCKRATRHAAADYGAHFHCGGGEEGGSM